MLAQRSLLILIVMLTIQLLSAGEKEVPQGWPPGWLPVNKLDVKTGWAEFRKIEDRIHIYFPSGQEPVRGIFVCYVFHSADPRELADLWNFALVTVPWPFEYDLGHNDKRNGRFKLGHPVGNMGVLLDYLNHAANETKHPELASAPLVGWLGQNGSHLCADLLKRAPERIIAWCDSFPDGLTKFPELTAAVPFAYAWEFTAKSDKERRAEREAKLKGVADSATPSPDFRCRANTYGFSHGIYSKFNFFAAFLDRCIQIRLGPSTMAGVQSVPLKPLDIRSGWVGDFNEVGEWNAIAPYADAKGMIEPVWLPDAYAAWMWRAYHSANPDIAISSPVKQYRRGGGTEIGLGYGVVAKAGSLHTFSAEFTGRYDKVEFHDGDQIVGVCSGPPWSVEGIKLEHGLHALFAVGVAADGKRTSSHPAFLVVK